MGIAAVPRDGLGLVAQCRLVNAQNRLGYLVWLAGGLSAVLTELEASRLAAEGTLCRDAMPAAERRWVAAQRPAEAAHWGLLTNLRREELGDGE